MITVPESVKKKGKKIWVPILAPKEFRVQELGESYVYLPEQLVGKTINVNLSQLTQDPKKQSSSVLLRINEIKENKGISEIIGYAISSSYLKRIGKMGRIRAEQSLMLKTKDNIEIRIKAIAVPKYKTNNSILTAVRAKMKESLTFAVNSQDFKSIMNSIIFLEFQKNLQKELKAIYPLSYVLVKSAKRIK